MGGFNASFAALFKILTRGPGIRAPTLERELEKILGPKADPGAVSARDLQACALVGARGVPARLESDLDRAGLFSCEEARALEALALKDMAELSGILQNMFDEAAGPGPPVFASFTGEAREGGVCVDAHGLGDRLCRAPLPAAPLGPAVRLDDRELERLLKRLFGHDAFKEGQREALKAILEGKDLSVLLPTAGGKSIIYQMAALILPGTALVVEPLLSLIRDQLRHLESAGISRAGGVGSDDPSGGERSLERLGRGELALCYVSPERFDSASFREAACRLMERTGFSFLAVDEAHCVTEWGHDFRPAYLRLSRNARRWFSTGRKMPVAALTGTGGPLSMEEVRRDLGLGPGPRVAATNLSRPELRMRMRLVGGDPIDELAGLLKGELGGLGSGIVFCPHVDGPHGAWSAACSLAAEGIKTEVFTGRAPAQTDAEGWERRKGEAAGRFMRGETKLLCATKAFGLGVHKPDIRFTVHCGLPSSLESFYQEAGRAGRDGAAAFCFLLARVRSMQRARRWLTQGSVDTLEWELSGLRADEKDCVSRALSLHLRAFPGPEQERAAVDQVLRELAGISRRREGRLEMPAQCGEAFERALLRLWKAGIVEISGRRRRAFFVAVSGGFSSQRARRAAGREIDHVYQSVEPARRRSLWELVGLLKAGGPSWLSRLRGVWR